MLEPEPVSALSQQPVAVCPGTCPVGYFLLSPLIHPSESPQPTLQASATGCLTGPSSARSAKSAWKRTTCSVEIWAQQRWSDCKGKGIHFSKGVPILSDRTYISGNLNGKDNREQCQIVQGQNPDKQGNHHLAMMRNMAVVIDENVDN